MSLGASGRTWEDAGSPDIALLTRRFEARWRSSDAPRPDPADYLPSEPSFRPAALLALLRADLALHWETGQRVGVEWYLERYTELDGEARVALLYEEYCLREEAGESPEAAEYDRRFPALAASFRDVLDIHDLIGRDPGSAAVRGPGHPGRPLPEAGQTMAGFRLVEELGRGAFARVFRAEERDLADRSVALKATWTGSREPQTLARLQHTHIVPVYSYRTDPATGLHLLCMPYLGRVTLADVLGEPSIRHARTGADLLAAIDRLQPADATLTERPVSRSILKSRSYARAIAWWGARLAEALQHAHDRDVLHRDIKPSNILMTGDALPMLLDFNLAQGPRVEPPGAYPAGLGGTLAYMAPEHLEALAEGRLDHDEVDARSDLYSLGVVLFECLARASRTLPLPSRSVALGMAEAMLRSAEERRARVPRLRDTHPDVPAALEAVVHRCLEADPTDRYASAAELAVDLQAVADDGPLRFAREPLPSRTVRWVRRHRGRLLVAVPLLVATIVSGLSLVGAQIARLGLEAEVRHWLSEGRHAVNDDRLDLAVSHFTTAAHLAEPNARLHALYDEARKEVGLARQAKDVRDRADELFARGERLRFALHGFGADARTARRSVESALARFAVLDDARWMQRPAIALLDGARRARLLGEVNDLLFLWVVALDRERSGDAATPRQAARICDAALAFAAPAGPWQALRRRYERRGLEPGRAGPAESPASVSSARACFQWALLRDLENDADATIAWLERATWLEPDDYWSHFFLGYHHERTGHLQRALEHYRAAVSLQPRWPWAWNNLALLSYKQGEWSQALDDLNRALELARGFEFVEARLNLGLVQMVLGDLAGARASFDRVIDAAAGTALARAAVLNRANLEASAGAVERAWSAYETLLAEDPRDSLARSGRALLALRLGRAAQADADLTILLRDDPDRADETFAHRALARLVLGRLPEAESDALDAYRRKPSPSHERLLVRTRLALGQVEDLLWIDDPEELDVLPGGGPSLTRALRAAAERLRAPAPELGAGAAPALTCRVRAVLLAALRDPSAEAEAGRAVALAPQSPEPYLVRARIRRRFRDPGGARDDVEAGLALDPGNPRLIALRGLLEIESGNPGAAIVSLDRAAARGARATLRSARAEALMALGRFDEALKTWSLARDEDPGDPRLSIGRARALIRLGRRDRALVELEQAADWAPDNAALLARIATAYAACLPSRPDRIPRWLGLVRRTGAVWIAAGQAR
jgi:serine/threonine protein kinase/Tfp pilus assembly protein PilF